MKKFFALLLLFSGLAFSGSYDFPISSKRLPDETFQQAVKRHNKSIVTSTITPRDTPLGKKVPVEELDYSSVPMVTTYDELMQMFNFVRDTRFLHADDNPSFDRRISWLYPDDGCFARAALSVSMLDNEHLIKPAKIFAFGDLIVQTPYSSSGYVSWWYHVSVIVNYMGVIYVLDPALDPQGPIIVEDWYNKMGEVSEINGAVCNPSAYDPFDDCLKATTKAEKRALSDQSVYLDKEWSRISRLGFDPNDVLGAHPPWMIIN